MTEAGEKLYGEWNRAYARKASRRRDAILGALLVIAAVVIVVV